MPNIEGKGINQKPEQRKLRYLRGAKQTAVEEELRMKDILRQKTTWAGFGTVVSGIGMCVMGDWGNGIQLIATGAIGIFLRQGVAKVGKK